MAVDTQLKRSSMINLVACGARMLPPPSGTVDAGERETFAYTYAMDATSGPASGGASFAGYIRQNINRMR